MLKFIFEFSVIEVTRTRVQRQIGMVGCGCFVATEPVAEISHQGNIPQVKHNNVCCKAC